MKKTALLLTFLLGLSSLANASELYEMLWNNLLQKNVTYTTKKQITGSFVDYTGIKSSQSFSSLIRTLSQFDTTILKTPNAQKAFWINTYNIAVVKLVTEQYPISSIHTPENDLLWKRPVIMIGNDILSLNDIETKKLTPFKDDRIPFALCNATLSGADLFEEAYTEETLDTQLDHQFKRFVTNETKGIDLHRGTAEAEFSILLKPLEQSEGGQLKRLQPFFSEPLSPYRIRYMLFNWSLNSK